MTVQNKSWQKLANLSKKVNKTCIKDLFVKDPSRFKKFSCEACGLFFDYSKNLITDEIFAELIKLVKDTNLKQKIKDMYTGKCINTTENRPVLHVALRDMETKDLEINGENVMPEIHETLQKMLQVAEKIRKGKWLGFSKKAITDVVNIGIGGSDLGPDMVTHALLPYKSTKVNCHFVSNVDATHIAEVLKKVNPETTLFIVASKTFTTQETLCNANTAKEWLLKKAKSSSAIAKHFIGITTKPAKAKEFGIAAVNVLPFWDWVGGRYSLWSALGLPIAVSIGSENFKALLKGANCMDRHFATAPFNKNLPVILALIGVWNINFLNTKSLAILPYDQYLALLPAYLQQLEMESNGKSTTLDGKEVSYNTAPVLWGAPGTNGQHAFHQLLMQGTEKIPVDFILPLNSHNPIGIHHMLLVANCLAQSQALMVGRSLAEVKRELQADGLSAKEIQKLAPHKVIPGDVPNNMLVCNKLTPEILGSLIALYEHKVFVQGVVWGINSFDQWGVELGKKLANKLVPLLQGEKARAEMDSSTINLIERYLKERV
jgi:glucose-6-phosphate isomerase